MKYDKHLITLPWRDYELLDSGDNMKLERFGSIITARPETQALWAKKNPGLWKSAHAVFAFRDKRGGWDIKKKMPEKWEMSWDNIRFTANLTSFKHTGIFPEQEQNWEWLNTQIKNINEGFTKSLTKKKPNILNLFGYTGIATLVSAKADAFVTHIDASKQSIDWAHSNARLSGISEDSIRWILDDALSFVKRDVRRGVKYDGIILDPPAFGRGAKGEVWKIEEQLPELLVSLKMILSEEKGSFLLLNGYASGYSSRSFTQGVESIFGEKDGECGELFIKESNTDRLVPSGIYTRFIN